MYYIEILNQNNKELFDDFTYRVQEFINNNINNSSTNLIDIEWIYDCDSYYPLSCIITYYKENS